MSSRANATVREHVGGWRRRILAALLLTLLTAWLAYGLGSEHAADRLVDRFAADLAVQFDGTSTATVERVNAQAVRSYGTSSDPLADFLRVSGHDPAFSQLDRSHYVARYRLETWGAVRFVKVTWSAEGHEILVE